MLLYRSVREDLVEILAAWPEVLSCFLHRSWGISCGDASEMASEALRGVCMKVLPAGCSSEVIVCRSYYFL